ncbi:MAG: hypothetical protein ACRESZ_18090 [Methylococcales bacterium]
MQAYYELETDIPANHELHIRLPETIPAGRAKIAVIYELQLPERQPTKNDLMAEFLNSLPDSKTQGLSREQIQAYITEERASWDD